MAGERQLTGGGEDPDLVVRAVSHWRQDEGGLGQVRPAREALHVTLLDAVPLENHGHRVAQARRCGEDIDLTEGAQHACECAIQPRRGAFALVP